MDVNITHGNQKSNKPKKEKKNNQEQKALASRILLPRVSESASRDLRLRLRNPTPAL